MSSAGQHDTYLNIRGADDVLDAVKRCWASLWTPRAIGYRARYGTAADEVSLAVVVQEFVPADAAGVLFTVDPVGSAPDRVIVNANWGLGEAVVGGTVTPDVVVVDRAGGGVVDYQVGGKEVMTGPAGTGTRERDTPAGQLGDGEILVTTVTNIGWTPIFPRAAAVVTDVGAPLSHAAIVARELGIPAVVGCRNATMRPHSGDRIRVDGGKGTVDILHRA